MNFYVRRSKDEKIEGPFIVEQINELVRQKRFTSESLALADEEQSLQEVACTPRERWVKLADLPGFQPDPRDERKSTVLLVIIIILTVLIPLLALIWLATVLNRIH
jgi:hypothetical protein